MPAECKIARDIREIEAVRGRQGEHDIVFGRGRLQLEIEFAQNRLRKAKPQARLMRLP